MKYSRLSTIILIIMIAMNTAAESYETLWKQVDNAIEKDLPKTQQSILLKIVNKAKQHHDYGQLLKAEMMYAEIMADLTPDSTYIAVERLEKEAEEMSKKDKAMAAVYFSVLGNIYANSDLGEDSEQKSQAYYKRSLEQPELLAKKKASELEPTVVKGVDSEVFNHDLLSLLGYQAEDYKTLYNFYSKKGNRKATLFTALRMLEKDEDNHIITEEEYNRELDNLIEKYGDLTECGEAAIARFNNMNEWTDENIRKKMEYADMALAKWGNWKRMNVIRNAQDKLTQSSFSMDTKTSTPRPGIPIVFEVNRVRNLKQLTLTITKTTLDGTYNYSIFGKTYEYVKGKTIPSTARQYSRQYNAQDFQTLKDTITVEPLAPGVYLVEATTNDEGVETKATLLHVSNLAVVNQPLPEGKHRVAVLNATTGQPVANADITFFDYQRKIKTKFKTDNNGETICPAKNDDKFYYVYVSTPEDNGFEIKSYDNNNYRYHKETELQQHVNLYSDRSIYRPGQTVHIGVVALQVNHETEMLPWANYPVTLTLRDANYKVVKEESVITDNFGTAWADFVLPQNSLTGRFTVTSNQGSGWLPIQVENYKRPTFDVTFDDYDKAYKKGDTVTVTGHAKSYAGVPVQGAKVKYTVKREKAWWCWWRNDNNSTETLAEGETTTDDDGTFHVDMPMTIPSYLEGFFNFKTQCNVSDQGGESHEGSISLPLGWKDADFYCDLPAKLERGDDMKTFTFILKNAAGKDVSEDVTFTIDGEKPTQAKTNQPISLKEWNIPSGKHVLEATCGDEKLKKEFILFSMNDQKPCYETSDWFYQKGEKFDTGKPAWIQLGSSDENVHVLYTMVSGNKLLESGSLSLNNSVDTRKLEYKEEYGAGVLLNYLWMKDGEVYTHQASIVHPLPDKKLKLSWTTFRDRLTPGQKETWTLHVEQPDGKTQQASPVTQLMATLFDKSLDKLDKHSWYFNDLRSQSQPWTRWYYHTHNYMWISAEKPLKKLPIEDLDFSVFSDEILLANFSPNIFRHGVLGAGGSPGMVFKAATMAVMDEEAMPMPMPMEVGEIITLKDTRNAVMQDEQVDGQTDEQPDEQTANLSVRENLQETAFFYPNLTSDKKGNVTISFTLPESLTTWKFIGLAHDETMNHAIIEAEAVAQKDVMVQPNMPRFVREGDQASLSAKLINTSERNIKGKASLYIIDPETEKNVWQQTLPFTVDAGKTSQATFHFSTDDFKGRDFNPATIYICKVVATGDGFSDGEQHYLPVLPNREIAINTLPFTQHQPGTIHVDLEKLFVKGDHQKDQSQLTIEYTNNPAWLMVQALPFVGNPYEKNAISLAAAYYANSISRHLLNQSPKIKQVFQLWQQEKGDENSLMSQLEKNQELKNIVLNETPWVNDAENETDQKHALSNYFDENAINSRLDHALQALKKLQLGDGSFSWWEGMLGSPCMTAEVMEFLTRLNLLTGEHDETQSILSRANSFLSDIVIREVKEFKQRQKEGLPIYVNDTHALQWVYVNAIAGRKLNAQENEAKQWLIDYLKKQRTSESIYAKALMAVVLAKDGQKALANEYLQSLEEYSVSTEEMGRYYETRRAGYSWFDYRIPTQVAAIEAFTLLKPEETTVADEMRRWLLMSKRTQAWDTPINSVNAVYAFLNGRMSKLGQKEATTFAIDGQPLSMPAATAGIGYVKQAQPYQGQKQLDIQKTSDGTSWGAVYARQLLPLDKIENSQSGIAVERTLLTEDGKPIEPGATLSVGQRIKVRITVNAERDYDFVQICDKRAACMEPVKQISGYHWGYYIAPGDNQTCYYFDTMSKGTHILETDYYVDREGRYETGTCTAQCAYSPEYSARATAKKLNVEK